MRLEGKVVVIGLALVLLSPVLGMSPTAVGFPTGFKPKKYIKQQTGCSGSSDGGGGGWGGSSDSGSHGKDED